MVEKSHNSRVKRLNGVAQTVAQTESSLPKYTERRGNVYWFKRRAPKPLKPGTALHLDDVLTSVGKNGYVKFTLRTSDARVAARLARKYAHLIDESVVGQTDTSAASSSIERRIMRQPTLVGAAELSREEIQRSANLMYADLLAADVRTYEMGVQAILTADRFDSDIDEVDLREPDRYEWSSADIPSTSLKGQAELLRRLMPTLNFYLAQVSHKVAAAPSQELLPFVDAFRRFVNAMEKRRQTIEVPTPEFSNASLEPPFTISVLFEKFKIYKKAINAWKDAEVSGARDYAPIVREFISVVGDKNVHELTRQDAEKYFEFTMARRDIALGTKKRNFDRIKAILNYGGNKHSIPDIKGPMEVNASYTQIHSSYERFTQEELKKLFLSDAYKNNTFQKASEYWLPLMGLYTGGRIEELASMPINDVVEIEKVWCYFLSSKEGNGGGKNKYAPRWVPIHRAVLNAGFVEHWRTVKSEGHSRLFPELGNAKRDGAGKRATDDFIDYRRSVNVGAQDDRSTKVFHSLRSTLISELIRRDTDDYIRQKLLGHSQGEDKKFNSIHFNIYDQSDFDAIRSFKVLAKANFGIEHPKFVDTPTMKAARARHLRKV